MIEEAQKSLGQELRKSERRQLENGLKAKADNLIRNAVDDFKQTTKELEVQKDEKLSKCKTAEDRLEIPQEMENLKKDAAKKMQQEINSRLNSFVEDAGKETVRQVETSKQEEKKRTIEDEVRGRLRGFTRTIPSFLMAYGDDTVVLETFDTVIPDNVFKDVTGITLDQFRFLRDGGDYSDEETGEIKHFDGNVFDRMVFNDSITEFLITKDRLANYFDESQKEDIFDYIPPQKTNQIFTPKWVVKKMVNMLEEENPGCFSDPNKTFADLYMKSGLYITEIVKKLFNDEKMKQLFPDDTERLQHIFEKQVYGLAPTEIIYKIATSFILGFDKDLNISQNNFRQVDALEYAKKGTLQQKIDELFGGDSNE